MQRTDGLHRVLTSATVYSLFQSLVGAPRLRSWLAEHFWQIRSGYKVVDIGCGPGDVLPYLPEGIEYIGFDPSEAYITLATSRFADRPGTTFLRGIAADFANDPRFREADVVLCNGVLHHLDDREVEGVLRFAHDILKPGGAFRCLEACFLEHQALLSRWIMGLDRGGNIRGEAAWRDLLRGCFDPFRTEVKTDLLRLPYVHILLEGIKPR